MGKAIILSRVSTLAQHLESQTNDLFRDASFRGYSKDQLIVIEDKESAIKLSEDERNGLNTMKYHIEHDKVDCVFIWEITRISRQLPMLYSIRDYLQSKHVQLYCHQPKFTLFNDDWSISDVSNMVFAMFAVLAENEMKTKKQRMLRARYNLKEQGKAYGGRPPFGYTIDKNKNFIVKEEEAEVVRKMFNDYGNGLKSIRKLAADLKAEGYFPNVKEVGLISKLHYWLNATYYIGTEHLPDIITQEMYDKCQEAFKRNVLVKHGTTNKQHLLKGLLYDKETGHRLTAQTGANSFYASKNYKCCTIRCVSIDPLVWEVASDIYYNKMNDKDTVFKTLSAKMQVYINKMKVTKENAESIQEKIDRVEERIIYGKISEDKANSIIDELDKSRKKFKVEHDRYLAESVDIQKQLQELMFGTGNSIQGLETVEQKIEIINKTISRIELSKPSRTLANVTIYNKYDNTVLTYQVDTWRHKYSLVLKSTSK